MRGLLLLGWLAVPVAFGAYHYGPGRERMRLDDAGRALREADRRAAARDWPGAIDRYDAALALLPADRTEDASRVRLQRAKIMMNDRKLPEAAQELEQLVDGLEQARSADPKLLDDAREAHANSRYYMTWLMRLEGRPETEWGPEIEGARQSYRLLAEKAESRGDAARSRALKEDLESTIRLARLDLDELQGLDLPSQCQGCKSGQCKKPGKKPGKNKNQATGKKDNRGASSGPPPDNSGS
jgi:hypothetical protein